MDQIQRIVGAIVGLAVLVGLGVNFYAGYQVTAVAYRMNEAVREASEPPTGAYNVENVKDDPSLWSGYAALTKIAEPSEDRVIAFNVPVHLRDLMKPGEQKPEADFADVFANARAGAFADAECGRVLKKLASRCAVSYASASRAGSEPGLYIMSGTLSFVQKDDLGKVDEAAQLVYRELLASVVPGGNSVSVMPPDAARQRERFYEEATRICAKMRRSEGNCAIYRININASRMDGSDALRLDGNGQFSFLQRVNL